MPICYVTLGARRELRIQWGAGKCDTWDFISDKYGWELSYKGVNVGYARLSPDVWGDHEPSLLSGKGGGNAPGDGPHGGIANRTDASHCSTTPSRGDHADRYSTDSREASAECDAMARSIGG